jgi:glutathione S-transferase
MNLYTGDKNTNSLKVVLVALYTGVKINIKKSEPTETAPEGILPVFEIDKTQSLFDTFAICRYLANKQKKVPLIPDDIDGFHVDEIIEQTVDDHLLSRLESSIQGTFLVGV